MTTREAAETLGISVEAVRKRIERGQLHHEREDNRVYVYLDKDQTMSGHDVEGEVTGALVESLQDQVSYLREQLAAERRANDENRRLLLAALERIPPQLEAPQGDIDPEARESPEHPEPTEKETTTRSGGGAQAATEGPQTTPVSHPRPWWRRVFGG
ncbi:MAG TPA: hypothetical protein VFG99_04920 [Chloroflexia bacterium]|nr:hypothetical protein [Chloroflexia bacterium]